MQFGDPVRRFRLLTVQDAKHLLVVADVALLDCDSIFSELRDD